VAREEPDQEPEKYHVGESRRTAGRTRASMTDLRRLRTELPAFAEAIGLPLTEWQAGALRARLGCGAF